MASSIRQPSTPALFFLLLLVCCCCQFRISNSAPSWTSAKKIFARGLLSLPLTFGAGIVHADDLNAPTYYFGVGCFWHVQHEFVQAEQSILNRPNTQVTATAGYAGGKAVGSKGRVCYHNPTRIAEYGDLGHAEVVNINIPDDKYEDFFQEYLKLFSPSMDRPDVGDRGPEYRSLIGLPGGVQNEHFEAMRQIASAKRVNLMEGKGNDDDTLGKRKIWVMDSNSFPFQQAEIYHQFHDGFMPGEQYPQSYNNMKNEAIQRGLIKETGCPDRLLPF